MQRQDGPDALRKVEFVIVDDGSKDKTWEIIQEWSRKFSPEAKKEVKTDLPGDLVPEKKGHIIIRGL